MNRSVLVAAGLTAVLIGGAAVWWSSQGTEAPSVGVTAPPVVSTSTTATDQVASGTTDPPPAAPAGNPTIYAFAEGTNATFMIAEVLRGTPTTVVGRSTIVLGEILYDPEDPASLQIGTVLVNARDFTTDSSNRNRAIRGPILDADSFEFIEFTPTSIEGFDGSGSPFRVAGDLTIRDVTSPVTFDVTATLVDDEVRGTATAVVDRTVWGLNIPNAPGVADVSEAVTLTLEFVAVPTS
jgi:polyisoprenoid-binding protein YceI